MDVPFIIRDVEAKVARIEREFHYDAAYAYGTLAHFLIFNFDRPFFLRLYATRAAHHAFKALNIKSEGYEV